MAVATSRLHRESIRPRWLQARFALPVILLLAALLRLWNIDQPKMSADESMHYFVEMQQIHLLSFAQQRQHPTDLYHATSPNPIGHPLFAVQFTNFFMQLFGPTESVARGVMAMAGVVLVGMIYVLGRELFDSRCGLLASLIAAFLPEAVRFNRTMYLDSIYAVIVVLLIWALVRTFASQQLRWFLFTGLLLGLAGATKTSAPFLLLVVVGYGGYRWRQLSDATHALSLKESKHKASKRNRRRGTSPVMQLPLWAKSLVMFIMAGGVFVLFVDPLAYLEAIRHPVDTSYQNRTLTMYLAGLWNARAWLGGVALYLWTPPVLLAAAAGLFLLVRDGWVRVGWRTPDHVVVLMVLWLISLGPVILLHQPGLSGEHGHLPLVAPVTLLAGVALMYLPRVWMIAAVTVIIVIMLPATILFGHRLRLLPYDSYLNVIDSQQSLLQPPWLDFQSPLSWSDRRSLQLPHGGIASLLRQ